MLLLATNTGMNFQSIAFPSALFKDIRKSSAVAAKLATAAHRSFLILALKTRLRPAEMKEEEKHSFVNQMSIFLFMNFLSFHSGAPLFVGEEILASQRSLSEGSQSDHMTLLRAFQRWQDSTARWDILPKFKILILKNI